MASTSSETPALAGFKREWLATSIVLVATIASFLPVLIARLADLSPEQTIAARPKWLYIFYAAILALTGVAVLTRHRWVNQLYATPIAIFAAILFFFLSVAMGGPLSGQ